MDGTIAILAARQRAFHGDPADRLIAASAMIHEAVLVTADQTLLEWKHGPRLLNALRQFRRRGGQLRSTRSSRSWPRPRPAMLTA